MPIEQAMPTSFKRQLLEGVHDFRQAAGDTFRMALYTDAANLGPDTAQYTTVGEVATGGGYAAGGAALTRLGVSDLGTTAIIDFADLTWAAATITARGALIYNDTPTHSYTRPACAVIDFGADIISRGGDFVVVFPAADAANAIIRIA
ncbi:hypothetical protein [Microcystis phage MJing1]|nr:hypothetical protein [Microcystis phage MJing1]